MAKSVDYLTRHEAPSALQHFWSLSIRGQFYLVWPALVAFAALLARSRAIRLRESVFLCCAMVFAVSLTYSIVTTEHRQIWAYFDTGARLWELALGGMFALALPHLRLPKAVRVPLGWFGLAALFGCGALLDVSTSRRLDDVPRLHRAVALGRRDVRDPGRHHRQPVRRRPPAEVETGDAARQMVVRALPVALAGAGLLSPGLWARHRDAARRLLRPGRLARARRGHDVGGRGPGRGAVAPAGRSTVATAAAFAVTFATQHMNLQRQEALASELAEAGADPESYPGAGPVRRRLRCRHGRQ
ncbi:acyltransferase family protein [Glycomyces tarimensis]